MVGDKKFDPKLQVEGGNQENSTLSPRCSICNVRKFATHKSFCNKSVNNLQKNISKPFKCSICNYEARVKSKLKRHFVGVHKMEFNAIQNTWISRITTALKNQRNKNNLFIEESIQSFNCCICDYIRTIFFDKSYWKNFCSKNNLYVMIQ